VLGGHMPLKLTAIVFLTAISFTNVARAQDVGACNSSLVITKTNQSDSLAKKLAILQTVKKSDFDQAQQSLTGGGSAFISDIPITASMSWGDFQQKKSEFENEYKYDLDLTQAYNFNTAYLSGESVQAYSECLRALHPSGVQIWLDPVSANPDTKIVTVHLRYNTPDESRRSMLLSYYGGTPRISPEQLAHLRRFSGALDETIYFERGALDKDASISMVVPGARQGASATIFIPHKPVVLRKNVLRKSLVRQISVGSDVPHGQLPGGFCFPAGPQDDELLKTFKISQVQATASANDPRGDQHASVSKNTPTQACATYNVGIDGSGTGHSSSIALSIVLEGEEWLPVN
jgi:hypothetical protein